jgi:hypothetical protein
MKKIIILTILVLLTILISGCTQQSTSQTTNLEQQQKQFCDNLTLKIENAGAGPGLGWGGIPTFCIYSSENDKVNLKIHLNNGNDLTNEINLQANSCLMHQESTVGFGDISYIQVISETCPSVQDLVTNMTELSYNNPSPYQQPSQPSQPAQASAKLSLADPSWGLISGWEQFITNLGNNKFNVPSHSTDALFIESVYNTGNADINDLVENIACNVVSGDTTVMSKFDYDGLDCMSSDCSYLQTENIYISGSSPVGTIGKKIRLPADSSARLNLRFFDKSGTATLVSQYTTVSCNANVYSQSKPEISAQSTITIYFNS